MRVLTSEKVALQHNVDYATCLGMVKEARGKGLTAPVILMGKAHFLWHIFRPYICHPGYYNPLLAYGEQKAIQDAFEAGANGFIVVDLPPEEAVFFREKCTAAR
jgi:tryptophan synthase